MTSSATGVISAKTCPFAFDENRTPTILLLSGVEGAGKSTYAQHLVDHHGFIKLAFADALRDVTSEVWNTIADCIQSGIDADVMIPGFFIEDSKDPREKEKAMFCRTRKDCESDAVIDLSFYGEEVTHRRLLQWMGTDVIRKHLGPDVWANAVIQKIEEEIKKNRQCRIVISDCRFENERYLVSHKFFEYCCVAHANIIDLTLTPEQREEQKRKILETGHVSSHFAVSNEADFELGNDKTPEGLLRMDEELNRWI